jgi:hypothetical protein
LFADEETNIKIPETNAEKDTIGNRYKANAARTRSIKRMFGGTKNPLGLCRKTPANHQTFVSS